MTKEVDASSWPDDWPIQEDDPLNDWKQVCRWDERTTSTKLTSHNSSSDEDADKEEKSEDDDGVDYLVPGGLLRSVGTADLHWARGAAATTATASGSSSSTANNNAGSTTYTTKKYLVLFPGLLSLNHDYNDAASSPSSHPNAPNKPSSLLPSPSLSAPAGGTAPIASKNQAKGEPTHRKRESISASSASASASASAPTILGRFLPPDPSAGGVATLTLFCNDDAGHVTGDGEQVTNGSSSANTSNGDGVQQRPPRAEGSKAVQCLHFEGRYLSMQNGKFLWVTNVQPKKRTVTCKHVFDSVLVLGNATAVVANAEPAAVRSAVAEVSLPAAPLVDEDGDGGKGTAPVLSLHHYGVSSRTVDGGNHRRAGSKLLNQKKSPSTLRAAAKRSFLAQKDEARRPLEDESILEEETKPSSSEESSLVEKARDSILSQDRNRRRSSRASAHRPVRYNDDECEDEGDNDEETGSDNAEDDREVAERAEKRPFESSGPKYLKAKPVAARVLADDSGDAEFSAARPAKMRRIGAGASRKAARPPDAFVALPLPVAPSLREQFIDKKTFDNERLFETLEGRVDGGRPPSSLGVNPTTTKKERDAGSHQDPMDRANSRSRAGDESHKSDNHEVEEVTSPKTKRSVVRSYRATNELDSPSAEVSSSKVATGELLQKRPSSQISAASATAAKSKLSGSPPDVTSKSDAAKPSTAKSSASPPQRQHMSSPRFKDSLANVSSTPFASASRSSQKKFRGRYSLFDYTDDKGFDSE
jgi:hypothetical protein